MARQFEPVFEAEIRRIVKNFNQKRARALNRGFLNVPDKQYVSRIKKNFSKRSDVAAYLKSLQRFNEMGDKAFNVRETSAGGKISEYNYQFIKRNLRHARDFYQAQINEAEVLFDLDPYSIARKDYLLNLMEKAKYLNQDIMTLSQSGVNTYTKYITQSLTTGVRDVAAYRGFMSELDDIMGRLGYDKENINKIYDKLSQLSPAEFVKLYRMDDRIKRIYDLMPSPEHGKQVINLSDQKAKRLIDNFIKNLDVSIEQVKSFNS